MVGLPSVITHDQVWRAQDNPPPSLGVLVQLKQLIHLVAGLRVGGRRSGPVIRQDSTGPRHDPGRD